MDGNILWEVILKALKGSSIEIQTVPSNQRQHLWFCTYLDKDRVYVRNAQNNRPSTKMNLPRIISKVDFLTVYSYYHRWVNGETNLRQEVRLLSRNTAYIFALISHFSDTLV